LSALESLAKAANEPGHQQTALVELGAIPAIVACISVTDPDCSVSAINALYYLCCKLFLVGGDFWARRGFKYVDVILDQEINVD
jgi:hypothetical protein